MAITRATGKAFRLAFSWIVVLAGYEATPAEEIVEAEARPATKGARPVSKPTPQPAQPAADQDLLPWPSVDPQEVYRTIGRFVREGAKQVTAEERARAEAILSKFDPAVVQKVFKVNDVTRLSAPQVLAVIDLFGEEQNG